MSTLVKNATRDLTLCLPEPLVDEAEELARAENIELGELFRLALRSYQLSKIHTLIALERPKGREDSYMTMEEVSAYIKSERRRDQERGAA